MRWTPAVLSNECQQANTCVSKPTLQFGKLLGHLHSAKSRLESEKGWKTTELNQKAQERLQEKLSLSKMNIQEFRRSQFEQQRREEEAKDREIERAIEEKEMLLLRRRLESHYSLMLNFIRTKAEPTIFYLPAKHTEETKASLEETNEAIKHKIASLKVQLQPMPEEEVEASTEEDAARASAAAAAVAATDGAAATEEAQPQPTPEEEVEASQEEDAARATAAAAAVAAAEGTAAAEEEEEDAKPQPAPEGEGEASPEEKDAPAPAAVSPADNAE